MNTPYDTVEKFPDAHQLLKEAEGIEAQLVDWRREFHQYPELGFEEVVTATRIAAALSLMPGMEVFTSVGGTTAVIGVLRGDLPGKRLGFRADMDALPVDEKGDFPFASSIGGVMHACGHDAHMASLLGAASLLSTHKEHLNRPVVFLFQPAEEGKGGAKSLVESGVVEKFQIDELIGMHWWPHLPYGQLFMKKGAMTAISDSFHVEIEGEPGHAATPQWAVDPVTIMAQIVLGVQTIIGHEIDPLESATLTFGQIESGFAHNIIPSQTFMRGTLRSQSEKIREFVKERLYSMIPLIAKAHRGNATVVFGGCHGQVSNDPDMADRLRSLAISFFGEDGVHEMEHPVMNSEDFFHYGNRIPTCYMLLGTGSEIVLHHPRYQIPESLLAISAAWTAYLGLRFARERFPDADAMQKVPGV